MTKKLYIKTYGCQMNVYDSGKMADLLGAVGYEQVNEPAGADMVILNTCHIREKAAEKMYSELGRIRIEKEKKDGDMLIAVAGCVGQAEGEEIFNRAPFVDIVVGPQSYQHLPDLVMKTQRDCGKTIDLNFTEIDKFDHMPEVTGVKGGSAFLTIQEGCDKFCTFCVVPYTRGAEFSRPVDAIYREAMMLVSKGAKEISLLGQNVNAYHGQTPDGEACNLGKLIKHIATIKGLERIRYTTSHPRDMHDALYEVHATEPKCMPYLHLPVQSGSDSMLQAMNRKHTSDEYRYIIEKLRKGRPDIAISSDFIVGFPGETDDNFEDTIRLVQDVEFAQCYSFKYSERPGTPAATKENQVPDDVKDARLQALQALVNKQQAAFNHASIGKTLPVLFEKEGREPGQLVGKSPYLQSVHVFAPKTYIGQVMDVHIVKVFANTLRGELVAEPDIASFCDKEFAVI